MNREAASQYNKDFLCERRLSKISPDLHTLFRNSIFAIERLLQNYTMVFPFYTDHSFQHAEQIINYCNILLGRENAEKLNADEIYILLMGACLHDVGMGLSEKDLLQMVPDVKGAEEYMNNHSGEHIGGVARAFHNEFSACFIRKYAALFEMPDEYIDPVCQVARGHRKVNLLDENEMKRVVELSNGQKVRLAYLAAIVKLADELDVTSNRNLLLDYKNMGYESHEQEMCFKSHFAIKSLEENNDELLLNYYSYDKDVLDEIDLIGGKIRTTFNEYQAVVELYPEFSSLYKRVRLQEQ